MDFYLVHPVTLSNSLLVFNPRLSASAYPLNPRPVPSSYPADTRLAPSVLVFLVVGGYALPSFPLLV